MQVEVLDSPAAARHHYERCYERGYMDRWERERFERLGEVLATIDLPPGARVLDFGCGSGALTRLLVQRWPHAEVHGADISTTAIAHARQRHSTLGCEFHVLDEAFVAAHASRFDLVFSHHVLEHVFDLAATAADLVRLLAPEGRMLHALPCGNPGSLAHWLCRQRPGGIETQHGNRFFFEEPSHLRRLCTQDLVLEFARLGCEPGQSAYGYHALGELRLMTELVPSHWFLMLHPGRCHARSLPRLLPLLFAVATVAALRAPCLLLLRCRRMLQQVFLFRTRRLNERSSLLLLGLAVPALLLTPLSLPVEWLVRRADRSEWRRRRHDPAGSEMMLEFARAAAAATAPRGADCARSPQPCD
ncbi:MAG TPA: class I SAM-dependent methyltransferase [Planctomycetota bacterium]|nr:class I SAM-dependent methyltransferase [Planctomycetota bacterium]